MGYRGGSVECIACLIYILVVCYMRYVISMLHNIQSLSLLCIYQSKLSIQYASYHGLKALPIDNLSRYQCTHLAEELRILESRHSWYSDEPGQLTTRQKSMSQPDQPGCG